MPDVAGGEHARNGRLERKRSARPSRWRSRQLAVGENEPILVEPNAVSQPSGRWACIAPMKQNKPEQAIVCSWPVAMWLMVTQRSQLLGRSHNPWMNTTGGSPVALASSICFCSYLEIVTM
jgi:hypothetical protein